MSMNVSLRLTVWQWSNSWAMMFNSGFGSVHKWIWIGWNSLHTLLADFKQTVTATIKIVAAWIGLDADMQFISLNVLICMDFTVLQCKGYTENINGSFGPSASVAYTIANLDHTSAVDTFIVSLMVSQEKCYVQTYAVQQCRCTDDILVNWCFLKQNQ